jgi:hypothetical protein
LLRTILAAACFTLGIALLVPASLRLWRFLVARLAPPEIPHLPDPLATFVFHVNGRPIGDVAVLTMASLVGAALLLAALRMVR